MKFILVIFSAILVSFFPLSTFGQVCTVSGQNCSDNCITTSGISRCGCPCGSSLNNDNLTCSTSSNCSLQIFIGIDFGRHVDSIGCMQNGPFPGFALWRNYVVGFLQSLTSLASQPEVEIGISAYSSMLNNLHLYNFQSNFSQTVNGIGGFQTPDCRNESEFIQIAQFAGEDTGQIIPFTYNGPGQLKARNTTTRIAIGVVNQYDEDGPNDDQILIMRQIVLLSFDAVVIVTRTLPNPTLNQRNTERARLAACGSISAPCPRVFWVDRVNDEGIPLSQEAMLASVNRQACNDRDPATIVSCENGGMSIDVNLCALQGLQLNELQFIDPSCTLQGFLVQTGDRYSNRLNYGTCGMTQEYFIENGVVKNRYSQTISTRSTTTSPTVSLSLSCSIPAFNDFSSFCLQPESMLTGSLSARGAFDITLRAYLNDSFTTLAPDLWFVVYCMVYMEVKVSLPTGLSAVVDSCWASPSSSRDSSIQYFLIQSGCPKDSQTNFLPSPTNYTRRFSFRMFEFASGYRVQKREKPPVYIHCKLYICSPTDQSSFCRPSCSQGRKKRALDTKNPPESVIATIGPLEVKDEEKVTHPEKTAGQAVSSYRLISIVTPWKSEWSMTTMLSYASLILIVFMALYVVWITRKQRQSAYAYSMINPPSYQDLQPLLKSEIKQFSPMEPSAETPPEYTS